LEVGRGWAMLRGGEEGVGAETIFCGSLLGRVIVIYSSFFSFLFLGFSAGLVSFEAEFFAKFEGGKPSFFRYFLRSYLFLINASTALLV